MPFASRTETRMPSVAETVASAGGTAVTGTYAVSAAESRRR